MCTSCSQRANWMPSSGQKSARPKLFSSVPIRTRRNAADVQKQKSGSAKIDGSIFSPCAKIMHAFKMMCSKNTIFRCASVISASKPKRCKRRCAVTGCLQRFWIVFRRLPHRRSPSSATMMSCAAKSNCANSTINERIRSSVALLKTMQRKKKTRSGCFLLRAKHMICCATNFFPNTNNTIRRKSKHRKMNWKTHGKK